MNHERLVSTFGQTVGVEKAESLIEQAASELGIECKSAYSPHEVVDICDTIARSTDGYLRVVANEIRAAEQAQRRFDALLDRLTDPIVTVRFDGSTPIVVAMNPAFEETFGYDASVVGTPLAELIGPGFEGEEIDPWIRSDRDRGVEVRHHTADDEVRTFIFRSVVVTRENGEAEGYGIYTDITERERRERTLELQNEQLDRFASVVSHDLRGPLSVAQGRVEMAAAQTDDEAVRRNLERAARAQDRMEDLITALLTLAREGQIVETPQRVAVQHAVSEAWSIVSTDGARLEVDGLDGAISADRRRLLQLLENLFRNSVEHGTSRDERADDADRRAERRDGVTVRVGWLSGEPGDFYVEDDGPGIPPEDRERVFDHGFTTDSNGTGFGLAIAKAITDAHEWSIRVTDGREGGARFEVTGVDPAPR